MHKLSNVECNGVKEKPNFHDSVFCCFVTCITILRCCNLSPEACSPSDVHITLQSDRIVVLGFVTI